MTHQGYNGLKEFVFIQTDFQTFFLKKNFLPSEIQILLIIDSLS